MSKVNQTSKQRKQQSSSKKTKAKVSRSEHGFWNETKENVSEGAKIIGNELNTIGKRFVKVTESLLGTVQNKTNEMYKYGVEITNNGNEINDLADHIKDDVTLKKLHAHKKELAEKLGVHLYKLVKDNKNKVPENLQSNKELLSFIKDLKKADKEISDYEKNRNK
ncbi:MAG: hypothetical protein KQH79_07250 [Bacteroidetes bacterium]|nr:hypothetical protein [Bacteroidota bacterium]